MLFRSKAKLPVYVVGLIPATDNRPSGNAYAPGDVITMYNGMTVEMLNADAEGRMILAKLIDEVEVSRHFMREEGGLQDRARLRVLETISSLISHISCLMCMA